MLFFSDLTLSWPISGISPSSYWLLCPACDVELAWSPFSRASQYFLSWFKLRFAHKDGLVTRKESRSKSWGGWALPWGLCAIITWGWVGRRAQGGAICSPARCRGSRTTGSSRFSRHASPNTLYPRLSLPPLCQGRASALEDFLRLRIQTPWSSTAFTKGLSLVFDSVGSLGYRINTVKLEFQTLLWIDEPLIWTYDVLSSVYKGLRNNYPLSLSQYSLLSLVLSL